MPSTTNSSPNVITRVNATTSNVNPSGNSSANANASSSSSPRRERGGRALITRWRTGKANVEKLATAILECESALERQRGIEQMLTATDMRDEVTPPLRLMLNEHGVRISEDLEALQSRTRALDAQGRVGQFASAYRTERMVDEITERCNSLHDVLNSAEVHAACVKRLHELCAPYANRPNAPLTIVDVMHAVYSTARDVSNKVMNQIQTHKRTPPEAIIIELVVAKVCGNNQQFSKVVRVHPVDYNAQDTESSQQNRNHNLYTAFVTGSIDHDANSLNALIVVGPVVNDP